MPVEESSSSSLSTHIVGTITVSAPETPVTELLCGASLCIQAGRRGVKQMLGSIISSRAFDLTEVGQAPGLEQECAEEQHDIPAAAEECCPDDLSDDTSIGSDSEESLDGLDSSDARSAQSSSIVVEIDESDDGDDLTTITAGTLLEDLGLTPPSPTASPAGSRQQATPPSAGKEEDLSVQIEKAVHRSLLRSIRNTAVLGTHSKKQTMLSASRAANSLFSFESDQCDENYLQELLKFEF